MSDALPAAGATGNQVVAELPPPPRALFTPSADEMFELRKDLAAGRRDARDREATTRTWRRIGVGVGVAGWISAAAMAWGWSGTYPLRRDVHHFTVLNDTDHTAAVFESTWDLPESKREALILGTAAQFVRACEGYSWVEAQSQYDYCAGLSAAMLRQEVVSEWDPTNKDSAQALFGTNGWKRVATGKPIRTGTTAIVVPTIIVAARPGEQPQCARRLIRLSYSAVKSLPTSLHLQYPTADIMFVGRSRDVDPTPIDPTTCR
ncbi:VirB8/TrbF family protein [Paracraurococcus lichenis]|uniref:VirB8/TrbF family protein n=1 Tax=Paracraurococcus lichenis TaxID=3064888 RepID=A0ABT9E817_9PROT|nr:VirB8/TrbF family protein [Paracraurococcus sp. LOR1-02]MDO9712348.1 VirB8/TrbF family protein [Paracraurococcus sp. LOR1-02]